jgi:hypothetical protein
MKLKAPDGNDGERCPSLWGWAPTEPAVLFVILDFVDHLCRLPVTLTDWTRLDDDDLKDVEETQWEQALSCMEGLFCGQIDDLQPSRNHDAWAARRSLDRARFDRWAVELGYAAYGLAKSARCGGTGFVDQDARWQAGSREELARRLPVLVDGPLVEARWRSRSTRLEHWQSVAKPPWLDHAIGIDEGIVDLIEVVWGAGLTTEWCCQGQTNSHAWIVFAGPDSARTFAAVFEAVPPRRWRISGSEVAFDAHLIPFATDEMAGRGAHQLVLWSDERVN